jgi:glycosyltransferase involved in cell wall biosynthesis
MLTVAVVIPTIPGREEMFRRAAESVEQQTRRPDEIVVEIDVHRTGAAHTRNRALQRVESDVIMWLDDDDEMLPNHVERLVRALEKYPQFDLVYPIPEMVGGRDPTATSVNGVWQLPWGIPFGEEQEYHLRNFGSFIPITHAVRTQTVNTAGGFPIPNTPEWPRPNVEDWGYLVRLLNAGARFYHLPVKTWRWHGYHGTNTGGEPDR